MRTAFVYPGQGSQYVGMGKDLFEIYPEIRELYSFSNEILGYEISKISFEGPEEKLKQTFITQPAILIHSVAATKLVKGIEPEFTAGHSRGEFSALIKSGALSFEDGLRLVKLRGELMQKAGEKNKGTMAAIVGLDKSILEEICKEASITGIVQVANFNSPGQIVVSALKGKKAMEMSKEKGAKLKKSFSSRSISFAFNGNC
jgi:[acyl-carrier-protein] S-malonyltransferase